MGRRAIGAAGLAAVLFGALTPVARAKQTTGVWQPGPPVYGVVEQSNVPVTMSDGNILRVNIFRPADPATGTAVSDKTFPVLLTQTPYGKSSGASSGTAEDTYLVARGYIEVVADVRGHGSSEGQAYAFDPREIQDGVELVGWSSRLPGSTGAVGLFGLSYLGINQLLTAERVGPHSPLKAIFPQVAANSSYRDLAFMGGIPNTFGSSLGVQIPAEGTVQPVSDSTGDPGETVNTEFQHTGGWTNFAGTQAAIQTGSPTAVSYYGQYWLARDPAPDLGKIVQNDIPTFLQGGWFDLFQRGETMNYAALQNASAGRALNAPMVPGQKVSGKFQLLQGPWYHISSTKGGEAGSDVDIEALQLRWFDRWLKNDHNGIDETKAPLHLWENTAGRWIDTDVWPLTNTATTWYLDAGPSSSNAVSVNDGTMTPTKPTAATAADQVVWYDGSAPCSTGEPALTAQLRCATDDRAQQAGPHALTYTADPRGATLAGPTTVTLFLTSTTADAQVHATIDDVAPDGTSVPVTLGALLCSMRQVDSSQSWYDRNGKLLTPYHPFTVGSSTPIPTGEVVRMDVELFGTVWRFAPGHKLRLTITTSDQPWAVPSAAQVMNLAGGVYSIQRNSSAASLVNLPLVDSARFVGGCTVCEVAP
jgi:putative CocE/NonD family hydrolase